MPTPPLRAAARTHTDSALAARPHAAADARSPAIETLEALGWLLHSALPPLRLQRSTVHDASGALLWQDLGSAVAADRTVAEAALAAFRSDASCTHHERSLDDGRTAVSLALRGEAGAVAGVVVLFADGKALQANEPARLFTPHVREILRRMARALAVPGPTSDRVLTDLDGDQLLATPQAPPGRATAAPRIRVSPLVRMKGGTRTHRYEVLVEEQVDAGTTIPGARSTNGEADPRVVAGRLIAWLQAHPRAWQSEPASFCLPLTAHAIRSDDFLEAVAGALSRSGVEPECIGFRLPESLARERGADARRFIGACERLGTFIVIDRFSPAAGLPRLLDSRAVRAIALDPQLANAVGRDRLARARVAALVQAARVLGLHCIAERVETAVAHQWLTGVGIDYLRGGAESTPVALEDLALPQP